MNSPWAIMATCMNWFLVRPTISRSFPSVSFEGYSVPSGMVSETEPETSRVFPVPLSAPLVIGFRCRGVLRTV